MSKETNVISLLETGKIPLDFNWNKENHRLLPPELRIRKSRPFMTPAEATPSQISSIKLVSEDLRDGLHGVSEYPDVEDMTTYVDAMFNLGVDTMTVGIYPGEKTNISKSIQSLLRNMREQFPQVTPTVLLQAQPDALKWGIECKQINPKLNAIVFMGTAPSRMLVQEWTKDMVLSKLAWATDTATKEGIDVIGATEHTTQTPPDFLREIIKTQTDNGAKYFCAADTIGTARPIGAYRLVSFVKAVLKDLGRQDVLVDWHGHRDMGNDTQNAMMAIAAGADRIHTVARGIGERAGNTQMEAVLLNLNKILEENGIQGPWNMQKLSSILELYGNIIHVPASSHGPMSVRAFESSLGIHTDAMYKALMLSKEARIAGKAHLADKLEAMARTVYSAVDPKSVGREQVIHVGPWSGGKTIQLANLLLFGQDQPPVEQETINAILWHAKKLGRELSQVELKHLLSNGS